MDADIMMIMVNDWLADNFDEYADLTIIGAPYYDNDLKCWCQEAEDKKSSYLLAENGGNIMIQYSGTK